MAKGVKLDLKASRAKRKLAKKEINDVKDRIATLDKKKKETVTTAKHGAKVKAVKKAKNGGKVTDPKKFKLISKKNKTTGKIEYFKSSGGESTDGGKTYTPNVQTKISKTEYNSMMGPGKAIQKTATKMKNGGALKSVPSKAKGLSKLPTSVRNKMGYMKNGGKVTDPPTKKKTQGGQLNDISSSDKKMKKTIKDVPKKLDTDNPAFVKPFLRPSKEKGNGYMALMSNPPKYRNLKTGKVISESEYYKVTGKKKKEDRGVRELKHGGKVKAMYGAKMKKAMYGAKMKKK